MALLNPNQIHDVLRAAKTIPNESKPTTIKSDLEDLLEKNSLSLDEVLDNVGSLMRGADQASTRLKAAETALKLHRVLDDDDIAKMPVVNIIIRDSQYNEVNPILVPR